MRRLHFKTLQPLVWLLLAMSETWYAGGALPHSWNHRKQYAVIVDAGSTGSRVHVYAWNATFRDAWTRSPYAVAGSRLPWPPIMQETYKYKVKPGIATFPGNDSQLTRHVHKLLEKAIIAVPQPESTRFFFMATAGMRLLQEDNANSVMDKIDLILSDKSINPFAYESGQTRILSGEEEGVFAWIQTNYLRGFFNDADGTMESKGILEMGGASTQIAFVPAGSILADKFPVRVAGVDYALYVHSYLTYGQDSAEKWTQEYVYDHNQGSTVYEYPCHPVDTITVETVKGQNVTFKGTGNATLCLEILNHLVYESEESRCYPKPCAIGTVYQPTIEDAKFFVATSAFAFAMEILKPDGYEEEGLIVPENVFKAAETYCSKTIQQIENETGLYDDEHLHTDCFTGIYTPLLLTKGYGFSNTTLQVTAKTEINGEEAGWTLGAIIYENERKEWACPAPDPSATTSVNAFATATQLTLLWGLFMSFSMKFL